MRAIGPGRRLGLLRQELIRKGMDSFLVTDRANVSYLSGFTDSDSILLITQKRKFFITDSRYIEEAQRELRGFNIEPVRQSTYKTLQLLIAKQRLKITGFESMNLPYDVARHLKGMSGSAKFTGSKDLVENIRAIKDSGELEIIRNSVRLAKAVLKKIASMVKPGVSEEFLSRNIELDLIKRGAEAAFKPIVAAGANSSKPHARAGSTKIKKNSFVMIDLGCKWNGYNSDITRMVLTGTVKKRFKKIYDIVRTAHETAIRSISPGVRTSDVDDAARRYIQSRGFGKYFGHSLGHGVGMEVHEEPNISKMNTDLLRSGMVFTVEPAIYIPGFGGVRIEDMVLVTDNGCEVLTR